LTISGQTEKLAGRQERLGKGSNKKGGRDSNFFVR